MTVSMLLYALMVSTLAVLVGILVVDAVRGRARRRRTLEDRPPAMSRARCGWRSPPVTSRPWPRRCVGRASGARCYAH
jgi:hypothetical protein